MIHKYTGLNFLEINDLNFIDYLQYRRDAFISKMMETESGREYLANASRLECVNPDRDKLQKFKK